MLTLSELRKAFWEDHPQHVHLFDENKGQNDYPPDVIADWIKYLDRLGRDRDIDQRLVQRATL